MPVYQPAGERSEPREVFRESPIEIPTNGDHAHPASASLDVENELVSFVADCRDEIGWAGFERQSASGWVNISALENGCAGEQSKWRESSNTTFLPERGGNPNPFKETPAAITVGSLKARPGNWFVTDVLSLRLSKSMTNVSQNRSCGTAKSSVGRQDRSTKCPPFAEGFDDIIGWIVASREKL